ncbi:MAG: cytochrome c3 family protein [Planctomycetota bacterium]
MSSQVKRRVMRGSVHKWFRLFWVGIAALGITSCQPTDSPRTDHGSQTKASAPARTSDNSECLICHMDFDSEELSVKHDEAGIGCISCHGASLAHGDDELNITSPDKLFGRAEIERFCKGCHRTHVKGKVYDDFVKQWHSKRRPNGRMILDDSVCTDCHGNHAILRPDQRQF